jgi:hypothetical protein
MALSVVVAGMGRPKALTDAARRGRRQILIAAIARSVIRVGGDSGMADDEEA